MVLSILKTPNDSLYQEACEHFGDVRRIGDMVAPRDVTAAIYEGEKLGRAL